MRRLFLALLLLAASSVSANPLKWTDVLRDVYVNGKLVRDGQTLVAGKMLAWIPPSGDALIFDKNSHQVSTADRSSFVLADDCTTATTDERITIRDGKPFVMPDDSTFLTPALVIHPHVSHVGPMTESDLWTTAPVWRAIYDHYVPDAATVKRLRDEREPATLTVYFATWCGDSKKGVPRLLKAVHDAANPNLRVELVGIGNDFLAPMALIQQVKLTNVPTVVVTRAAREVGRVVETPATSSIEGDVAAILDGKLPPHPGRYDRKKFVLSGDYDIKTPRRSGTEHFEIWSTEHGGMLVRSTIKYVDETIETFAAIDNAFHPDFAEVTRRTKGHVVRTRCSEDHGKWHVVARGDEFGIAEQTTDAPTMIVTPATATLGWPLFCSALGPCKAYVIGDEPLGELVTMSAGTPSMFMPASLKSQQMRVTLGSKHYDFQPISALNVPKHVRFSDGGERRLVGYSGVLPRAIPATDGQ